MSQLLVVKLMLESNINIKINTPFSGGAITLTCCNASNHPFLCSFMRDRLAELKRQVCKMNNLALSSE